jgi:hypothetical protein
MDDRFDQEFYRSRWQRVLAAGPDGNQPYVHTAHTPRLPGSARLGRAIAILVAAARRVIAFGRFAAVRMAKRPMLSQPGLRAQRRSSLRLVHATARPPARQTRSPRRPSRAA